MELGVGLTVTGLSKSLRPVCVISSSESSPSDAATIPITITFSTPVTGFVVGDIVISGCSLSGFAGSGSVYTVTATPTSNFITIDVPEGVCSSPAGVNYAATQFAITSLRYGWGWHYDFSDLTTLFQDSALTTPVTTDSQPIGGVLDKSGNGRNVTQPSAGARPPWKAAIQNGRGVLSLPGGSISQYLLSPVGHDLGVGTGNFYWIAAGKPTNEPFSTYAGYGALASAGLDYPSLAIRKSDGKYYSYIGGHRAFSTSYVINQAVVIELYRESSTLKLAVNGVLDSTTYASVTTSIPTDTVIRIGFMNATAAIFWGYLFEERFRSGLPSTTYRDSLRSYIMSKWGF